MVKRPKIKLPKPVKNVRVPMPGYLRSALDELKQVQWPSRRQSWRLTFAVIVFSAFFGILIVLADIVFKLIAERIFL